MEPLRNEDGLFQTPMYDYYVEAGYDVSDFGGWALPIQFSRIQEEHDVVRNDVGIFDASHMGEVFITGNKEHVLDWLNGLITNEAHDCAVNQAQYTAVVKEDGGTLDDLIYYRNGENEIIVTPNASNRIKIVDWFKAHNQDDQVTIDDRSLEYGLIAVQGPKSEELLQSMTDCDLSQIKSYHFLMDQTVDGVEHVIVSRTGYTGENGFELYIPWNDAEKLWRRFLELGEKYNLKECGLGARDTLRLEGGMALYGNDLSEDINPIEGGIGFAVKTDKEADFIGKEALKEVKKDPNRYISRGFELTGKGIARHGAEIFESEESEEPIGFVTSGTKSPTFGKAIGYALIRKPQAEFGKEIFVQIRNKRIPAVITKKDWLRHR